VIGVAGEKLEPAAPPKETAGKPRPSVGVVGELEEAPEEIPEEIPPKIGAGRKEERAPAKPIPTPPLERGEILAVPMVRKLAGDLKVDLRAVKGSGPQGRITKEDVSKGSSAEEARRERNSRKGCQSSAQI